MKKRVAIHVGCPKTGTTGIQRQLVMNPVALAAQGFVYPDERPDQHFLAAVEALDLPWNAEVKAESVGAWARLVERIATSGLDGIVSHELFARASEDQIGRIVEAFDDLDVSVIITARDLARVIPAEYQEHLKHRSVLTYRSFLDRLQDLEGDDWPGRLARLTWRVQDVPAIAARWGSVVGAENVAVVTVPQEGAPRDLLMSRFGQAIGLDTSRLREVPDLDENRSLGLYEAELLRRFNERYNDELDDEAYGAFVRGRLLRDQDGHDPQRPPLELPAAEYGWVREVALARNEALRIGGFRIVGDLEDLLPARMSTADEVVSVDEAQLLEIALGELARSVNDYEERGASAPGAARRMRCSRLVRRGKRGVVRQAAKRPLGQRILDAWESRR